MIDLQSIVPWKKEERSPALRRETVDPFFQLQRRINGMFDDFLGSSFSNLGNGQQFLPQMDVTETAKEIKITAELPGLDEKDVDVSVLDNMVSIRGEKTQKKEEEEQDSYYSERSFGSFERTIALPQGIDTEKVNARFKKGVLKITIPKKPEAQSNRRKIELIED